MVYVLFLQVHYKESQLYLTRFKQYLSRALALVKQHVVNTLRAATASILPKPVNLIQAVCVTRVFSLVHSVPMYIRKIPTFHSVSVFRSLLNNCVHKDSANLFAVV